MSYSFNVTGVTKHDVCQQIADEFGKIVLAQPSHKADSGGALTVAQAFVNLLADPAEGEEINISVYGSLSWNYDTPDKFRGANVSVTAVLRQKK